MKRIVVKRDQLYQKLLLTKENDLIELRIVPAQNDLGNYSPAFLHIATIHNKDDYEDLESIDEYLADMYVIKNA